MVSSYLFHLETIKDLQPIKLAGAIFSAPIERNRCTRAFNMPRPAWVWYQHLFRAGTAVYQIQGMKRTSIHTRDIRCRAGIALFFKWI